MKPRLTPFLLVLFPIHLLVGSPLAGQEVQKDQAKPVDTHLLQIEKAVMARATKKEFVHFKIKIEEEHPFEDIGSKASGEVWSFGEERLRYKLETSMGRMVQMKEEIVINEKGAWIRFPMSGVVHFSADLWKKIRFVEEHTKAGMSQKGGRFLMNPLERMRGEGFTLKWVGLRKVGALMVDEIEGTKESGDKLDKCRIWIGEKDHIPRRIEWFKGKERIRLMELSNVETGKKIPKEVFSFKAGPKEQVVDAIKHPSMRQSIDAMLKKYEELKKKEAKPKAGKK